MSLRLVFQNTVTNIVAQALIYDTDINFKNIVSYHKNYLSMQIYRERQKLMERKVSQFTGFPPKVGKTFVVFPSSVLKVLPLLKAFVGKTFAIHQNP